MNQTTTRTRRRVAIALAILCAVVLVVGGIVYLTAPGPATVASHCQNNARIAVDYGSTFEGENPTAQSITGSTVSYFRSSNEYRMVSRLPTDFGVSAAPDAKLITWDPARLYVTQAYSLYVDQEGTDSMHIADYPVSNAAGFLNLGQRAWSQAADPVVVMWGYVPTDQAATYPVGCKAA